MGKQSYFASEFNMAYATASGTTWTKNSARQGTYSTTKYYGVAMFGSIQNFDPAGKTITGIKLTMDFNQAGGAHSKTLNMYKTAKTSITGTGSAMLGASIGSMKGTFYGNTHTWEFSKSYEPGIFNALVAHITAGGRGIAFYANESKQSSVSWSLNYLSIAAVTMTITWADDYVYYNKGGTWIKCAVYVHQGGTWKRCKAHYNKSGTWQT